MVQEIWQNIADNISDALLVQDRHGNIIYANSAALDLFGYSLSEALTFNSYELYENGVTNVHIFGELLERKTVVTTAQIIVKKDLSQTPPLLVSQTPIFDENGDVKYSIEVIRDMDALNHLYQSALRHAQNSNREGRSTTFRKQHAMKTFIVSSDAMNELLGVADRISDSSATVLIQGESGTGKELLAEYIHKTSTRRDEELVAINCAALPENLLESELFGYEQGSFTGASSKGKPGLIELAHNGTLLLDEIDSLPLPLQGKLLRVIETGQIRRVGSVRSVQVDFRLISATNADLEQMVFKKEFRADLYHRLNILLFRIPPLRERREEIRPLCEYFLKMYSEKYGRQKRFSEHIMHRLEEYAWPGNVRELRNLVERTVLMTDSHVELVDDIPDSLFASEYIRQFLRQTPPIGLPRQDQDTLPEYDGNKSLKENVRMYERKVIENVVKEAGSLSEAAKMLDLDKSTLIRKRK